MKMAPLVSMVAEYLVCLLVTWYVQRITLLMYMRMMCV